jgi:hypothetical protein
MQLFHQYKILTALQVYLIASTIAFCAQALALTDSKFPVWYPYYGTWFLGLVVELVLAVVPNVFRPPKSPFDYAVIVIQSLRICIFMTLPSLYFGLRNDQKEYDNCDAERQSLLRKKLAPKASSSDNTRANGNGYGATTDANAQESDTADNASDAGSEDSWLAEQRKAQEMIDKRLQQDGNWFTYAKGFTVSSAMQLKKRQPLIHDPRYFFRICGHFTAKLCSFEQCLLVSAC